MARRRRYVLSRSTHLPPVGDLHSALSHSALKSLCRTPLRLRSGGSFTAFPCQRTRLLIRRRMQTKEHELRYSHTPLVPLRKRHTPPKTPFAPPLFPWREKTTCPSPRTIATVSHPPPPLSRKDNRVEHFEKGLIDERKVSTVLTPPCDNPSCQEHT